MFTKVVLLSLMFLNLPMYYNVFKSPFNEFYFCMVRQTIIYNWSFSKICWWIFIGKCSYSHYHDSKIKTRYHEMRTHPGPQNTLSVFFQNILHYVSIFDLKDTLFDQFSSSLVQRFHSVLPWTSSLAKTIKKSLLPFF